MYILYTSPFSDIGLVKIFFQSFGCLFVVLTFFFAFWKFDNFMRSYLSILDLIASAICILFRKIFPVLKYLRLFPTFFSITFTVSGFMRRCLIHSDLNFIQGMRMDQIAFFYMLTASWSSPFWENAVFSPLDCFSSFVKDQVTIVVLVPFWAFNSILLNYMPVPVPIQCSFYYYCSVVQAEVRDGDSARSSFIVEKFLLPCCCFFNTRRICKLLFLVLWKTELEFWRGLDWFCRLLSARWSFLIY